MDNFRGCHSRASVSTKANACTAPQHSRPSRSAQHLLPSSCPGTVWLHLLLSLSWFCPSPGLSRGGAPHALYLSHLGKRRKPKAGRNPLLPKRWRNRKINDHSLTLTDFSRDCDPGPQELLAQQIAQSHCVP